MNVLQKVQTKRAELIQNQARHKCSLSNRCAAPGGQSVLWGRGSLERRLHPPQLLLELPCLRLVGPLEVRVAVGDREGDVRGGELGDAPPQVPLQPPVGAVREGGLLEGLDLTHKLRYVPWWGSEKEEKEKLKR